MPLSPVTIGNATLPDLEAELVRDLRSVVTVANATGLFDAEAIKLIRQAADAIERLSARGPR